MASSNRHWPSLFKSKPHSHHHQWQHDISPNPLSLPNGCHRAAPYSSSGHGGAGGGEERSPEPKPRWNPKPEQIRILEAIFNSGMVNPPREEIRKIRAQLQEYGQVGDANVFYWFQNRKSRSKNKQRHLHNHHSPAAASSSVAPTTAPSPSPTSSSSSEKSSSTMSCLNSILNSTTTSSYNNNNGGGLGYNNYNFAPDGEFFPPEIPFLFQEDTAPQYTQGFCFSELSNVVSAPAVSEPSTNLLLSELMSHGYNNGGSKKDVMIDEAAKMKMETQLMMSTYSTVSSAAAYHSDNIAPPPSTINLVEGVGMADAVGARSTMMVFVNDVVFEVPTGLINVRETFGDDVALINSNGQPVLTSEWGVTLVPLQAGAFYYVI